MRCVLTACALLLGQSWLVAASSDDSPDSRGSANLPNLAPAAEAPTPPPPPTFPPPISPEHDERLAGPPEMPAPPDFENRPGFTHDSTGFDSPFWIGVGASFPTLSGRRVLPPGFDPVAAARFPTFNQAGLDAAFNFNAGLTYRTDNFGALTLGYRAIHSDMTIAQAPFNGPLDPLVLNFLNNAAKNNDDGSSSPPRIILVPDEVGSCLASSRLTLQQLDLFWSTPPAWIGGDLSLFAQVGVRAASFIHEDSTNSLAIFQQAKDRYAGVGPVGGINASLLFKEFQLYGSVDAGELFGTASQFDREMAILKHSTRVISDSISSPQNVTMLGVQAGIILFSTDRLSIGIDYRFDQWWNLARLRGPTLDWSNHAIGFQFRWRL